ncbi:tetratricopeptide repeat protein [Sulfurimonas sp.]
MKFWLLFILSFVIVYASQQSDMALANHNYKKAFELLSKEAKSGDAEAQYNLALMYYMGDGVEQNVSMSAKLLDRSAKAGFRAAKDNVGRIYMQLLKFNEALPWLLENATNGDRGAYYLLAEIYVEQENFKEAKKWAYKAIKAGNSDAKLLWNKYNLERY